MTNKKRKIAEKPHISSIYRSHVALKCTINHQNIGDISAEQSAIFDDNRSHYICTVPNFCVNKFLTYFLS